jgi:hypothetical protein
MDGCIIGIYRVKGLLYYGTIGVMPLRTLDLSMDLKDAVDFMRNYSWRCCSKRMLSFRKYWGAKYDQ